MEDPRSRDSDRAGSAGPDSGDGSRQKSSAFSGRPAPGDRRGVELAGLLGVPVISCDSMQIYRVSPF